MSTQHEVYRCELCNYTCRNANTKAQHLESKKHFVEFLKYYLWQHEETLVRDKHHVTLSCNEVEDCLPTIHIDIQKEQCVKLTLQVSLSRESQSDVLLQACTLLHPFPLVTLEDECGVVARDQQVKIFPGGIYTVVLVCCSQHAGKWRIPLALKFQSAEGRIFSIVRYLEVLCSDGVKDDLYDLEPSTLYQAVPPLPRLPDADKIVRAEKPKSGSSAATQELERNVELNIYKIPDELRELQKHGLECWDGMSEDYAQLLSFVRKHLDDPLSEDSYWGFFSTLLFLEEIQMSTDIRTYDMVDVPINPRPTQTDLFVLEVPGLMESRPSVLKGDRVYARLHSDSSDCVVEYEGYVCDTMVSCVALQFSKRFSKVYIKGMKFDVRFTFNRLPLRLMHRAISMVESCRLWDFVFPEIANPSAPALKFRRLNFFNKKVEKNAEQFTAVKNILLGLHRPYPYLLFGPPGTGKTVTLVEAMKQVFHLIPSSKILVVAPSNSAGDLLAERLLEHLMPSQIFRMYSSSLNPARVSKKLLKCCNYIPNMKTFWFPARSKLEGYRIIVATLATGGRLVSADFPLNHFTHIFIDEAGHALEPECLIPIVGLMSPWDPNEKGPGSHLILAGDPMQLGPVIRNRLAKDHNLGVSLLERLMELPVYQRHENGYYNPQLLTKLLKNFRSHKDVLHVPNQLFYESELQVFADEVVTESLSCWEKLPSRGCPLIFHGVQGRDLRESHNPSYYNPEEIKVVVDYVMALLDGKGGLRTRVREEDIGIVSPYRKQVLKIRGILQKRNKGGVTVGSTEEFQGQERLVIIITTVRSNPDLLSKDIRHNLGFLRNSKRFNVAVTRAKALLIIVGNPWTLSGDPCWNKLLQFCIKKKAYCGVPFGDVDEELHEIERRFARANIGEELSPEDRLVFEGHIPITQKTLQEEPRWRDDI
ncbi:putative helicase MOV-10 [Ornithodoros turicata]|uniref:putative helicase MOV-10 n=1 Tax=Ornithodoros turicata TaxID=34597 RepID=UPI00313A07CC